MNVGAKDILKLLVSLGLAAGLLYLFFRYSGIQLSEIVARFQTADYRYVLLSVALAIVAHWSRAARWRMLIEPTGHKPTTSNAFLAVLTGYFANTLVPRLGEVTRCGTLNRLERIPVNVSFGTVVAERIIDVLALLVLLAATFVLEFGRLSNFFIDFFNEKLGNAEAGSSALLYVVGALIGLCIVAWVLFSRFHDTLRQKPVYRKLEHFVGGLWQGLTSVGRLRNPLGFLAHTVLIWTLYYLMGYVLFFAVPETGGLGPLAGLTILVVGAIGMTTPTPGGTGSFQILVGSVLMLYGLQKEDGGILATFVWAVQTLTVLLIGGLAFVLVLLRSGQPGGNVVTQRSGQT